MKKILIFLIAVAFNEKINAYEVINNVAKGYEVTADQFVYINTPDGNKIQVTAYPFITKNYSLPPTGPIICSWDPTYTWLAIFIPNEKTTEIQIYSLKKGKLLLVNPKIPKFPNWFSTPQRSTKTTPEVWRGNELNVNMQVIFKNGKIKFFPEIISISDNEFTITPKL